MKTILKTLSLLLAVVAASNTFAADKSPNIVLIMADDFGYGSTNCYGAAKKHIRTPNIDQLAENGMRFTDGNTPASVCSPTRYAMLTGRYAWRGKMKYGVLSPPEGPLVIEPELVTLPEYLQEKGYTTAHIGKWHLGYTNLPEVFDLSAQPLEPGPRSLGFDYHFALPNQIDWTPKVYVENESIYGLRSKGKNPYGKSFYKGRPYDGYDAPQRIAKNVTQDLSDKAREWIRKTQLQEPNKPFFLYFAPVACHHPISPSDEFRGTSGVGPYGDFIHDLDNSVGDIMDTLEYAGIADDTIVIFTSDNGGDFCPESERAIKDGLKINGEMRGDKHLIYQGGLRVPFVVRWPGKVKKGSTSDRMINTIDLYATIQELLSGKVADPTVSAVDSFSFYSELVGKKSEIPARATMVQNDVAGVVAIRMGDWKYVEGISARPGNKKRKQKSAKPELYNLKKDPAEADNVISQNPEVVAKMQKALDKIRSTGSERTAAMK